MPAPLLLLLALHAQQPDMVLLATQTAAPLTASQRSSLWAKDTFNTGLVFGSAFPAAFRMLSPSNGAPRNWRSGGAAYARNVGDFAASQVASDTVNHLAAGLFHEEVRYRRSASKAPLARFAHAAFSPILQTDASGHHTPAFSTLTGAAAGGFLRRAYAPDGFNDNTHSGQRTLLLLGNFAIENVFREFAPELCRLAKKVHLPTQSSCR